MIKKIYLLVVIIFLLISVSPKITDAQSTSNKQKDDAAEAKLPVEYEASPAYPFGRLNPKAPAETAQFDFMIGEFDCKDRILNPQNGKWFDMNVVRRAAYVLNGHAIQDQNWLPIFNTSNFRIFDTKDKKWKVTYFKMPDYQSGVWEGGKEGENIVLRQINGKTTSQLSFFNISASSYSWKAETITDGKIKLGWEFTCKRRR